MVFTRKRTLAQTVTWRAVSLVLSMASAYLVTGSMKEAGAAALVYTLVGLVAHYLHDRAWLKVRWGRVTEERA